MAKLRRREGKARYFEFLIDSGADYTLISRYDAELLGIKYDTIKQKEIKAEAANRTSIHVKKVTLTLTVDGRDFTVPTLIALEEVEALLGRKGLFEHFDILFQEREEQVVFSGN